MALRRWTRTRLQIVAVVALIAGAVGLVISWLLAHIQNSPYDFAELNDDSKGWRVTPVGNSATFTWNFTARHATSTFQYFVDGQKIAEVDGHGEQPPSTVSHQVDFGGLSGQQKVLAVWNIADTANAFYACVDVNVG